MGTLTEPIDSITRIPPGRLKAMPSAPKSVKIKIM